MIMRLASAAILLLAALFFSYVGWLYAHHELFYRRTVVEAALRFEPGFSIRKTFTVDTAAKYEVGIRYDEVFRSTAEAPLPHDEFTAHCDVHTDGDIVASADTETLPAWRGPWVTNRDQVTRIITSFQGHSGRAYILALQITSVANGLDGKNPTAIVTIEPRLTVGYELRRCLVICGSVVFVFIAAVYLARFLRSGQMIHHLTNRSSQPLPGQ
jgi:hypothetical protein